MPNLDTSPHVNRLERPPRFPDIFEEDEGAPEDTRCQSPTPVTRRKKPCSTSSALQPHVLARPSSPPPPVTVLQAPIVATISTSHCRNRTRNGYRSDRAALSRSAAVTQALVLLAPPPRAARHPPLRKQPAPRSSHGYDAIPGSHNKKSMRQSTDTGDLTRTMT
jgi:hypothetical protein